MFFLYVEYSLDKVSTFSGLYSPVNYLSYVNGEYVFPIAKSRLMHVFSTILDFT